MLFVGPLADSKQQQQFGQSITYTFLGQFFRVFWRIFIDFLIYFWDQKNQKKFPLGVWTFYPLLSSRIRHYPLGHRCPLRKNPIFLLIFKPKPECIFWGASTQKLLYNFPKKYHNPSRKFLENWKNQPGNFFRHILVLFTVYFFVLVGTFCTILNFFYILGHLGTFMGHYGHFGTILDILSYIHAYCPF